MAVVDELGEAEGVGKDDYQASISRNWRVMLFTEEEIRDSGCVCACMHVCVGERISFGHEALRCFLAIEMKMLS